jgi:hypothetical protein
VSFFRASKGVSAGVSTGPAAWAGRGSVQAAAAKAKLMTLFDASGAVTLEQIHESGVFPPDELGAWRWSTPCDRIAYVCVCVRTCVRACVRACVCEFVLDEFVSDRPHCKQVCEC